jgi:hypothetical protein
MRRTRATRKRRGLHHDGRSNCNEGNEGNGNGKRHKKGYWRQQRRTKRKCNVEKDKGEAKKEEAYATAGK